MVTPTPRPVDIAQVFPELRSLAKSATRLHPRRGEPQVRDSSIGGPLLWPADEAWPACRLPRMVKHERPITPEELRQRESDLDAFRARFERALTSPDTPDEAKQALARFQATFGAPGDRAATEPRRVVTSGSNDVSTAADPMVGLLQLHAADAPSIAFPDDADLLQLLWCTHMHYPDELPASPHHFGPAPLVVWRLRRARRPGAGPGAGRRCGRGHLPAAPVGSVPGAGRRLPRSRRPARCAARPR
jgi:hypothetical protein